MTAQSIPSVINDLRTARSFFRPDWDRRSAAAKHLGSLRAKDAVGDLVAVINENQNADLCMAAIWSLGQIGTPEAVAALIAVLGNLDVAKRGFASKALAAADPQVSFKYLLMASVNAEEPVSSSANAVLQQIGDLTPLLSAALVDSDIRVSDAAHKRLLDCGKDAIPVLLAAVTGDSPNVQVEATRLLAQIGVPAVPDIIKAMHQATDPARGRLVKALAAIGQPAIAALSQIGTPEAVTALIAILGQPDVAQRDLAAKALAAVDPQVSFKPLLLAAGNASQTVSSPANEVLQQFGNLKPLMVAALADSDNFVRDAARKLLGESGEDAIPALVAAVAGDSTSVQVEATKLLAQIGAPAVPDIVAAVRQAVDPACGRLVNRSLRSVSQPSTISSTC